MVNLALLYDVLSRNVSICLLYKQLLINLKYLFTDINQGGSAEIYGRNWSVGNENKDIEITKSPNTNTGWSVACMYIWCYFLYNIVLAKVADIIDMWHACHKNVTGAHGTVDILLMDSWNPYNT